MYHNHYDITLVTDQYSLDGAQLRDILRESLEQYEGGCCIECVRTEPCEDPAPADKSPLDEALQEIDSDADAVRDSQPQALERAEAASATEYETEQRFLRTYEGKTVTCREIAEHAKIIGLLQKRIAAAMGLDKSTWSSACTRKKPYPYVCQTVARYTGARIVNNAE